MSLYLGIDIGSTTVKVVLSDENDQLLDHVYQHARGQPGQVLLDILRDWEQRWDFGNVQALGLTGSGGGILAPLLGGLHVNELIAQTYALDMVAPHARTVIEMGGQDSKLLILEQDNGRLFLTDFAMNTLCAAGTGSFLDQQAERLGIPIEEFAELARQSKSPARVAGRCTVFAKSDMIHLQQRGVPVQDIVAGLCQAVARNFRSIIGQGKIFHRPILFQGGVALNSGMIAAFEQILGLDPGELIVPPHCTLMAALGAARVAQDQTQATPTEDSPFRGLEPLANFLNNSHEQTSTLLPLHPCRQAQPKETAIRLEGSNPLPVYLGVDVGSISTKATLLNEQGDLLARCYLYTAGRPLEAVQRALQQIAEQLEGEVQVLYAGVTGSGRHLVGDYIGADLVRNEISAQARAALELDPKVDTVFEIGGQDSKYIRLSDGVVVDFCMNRACAAGTGSFLEEQAQRLQLEIEAFGPLALTSPCPSDLGERCTVFMESELVHHQQQGARRENLVAGLAYSIARNYLNRVVNERSIGQRILFQGGVAANPAVVAAFEQILGRPVTVPPHNDVSGAIGVALLAMEERGRYSPEKQPACHFYGFDLSQRPYQSKSFECKGCPNHCEIQRISVEGEQPYFYGARCERYDEKDPQGASILSVPDPFAERDALMLHCYQEQLPSNGKPRIGLPRVFFFYELLPFWSRLFQELGWEVVLSPPTTPEIAAHSVEGAGSETCFPVKLVYGHVLHLLDQGVERIFLPSLVNRDNPLPGQQQNYLCPFIQASPHLVIASLQLAGRLPLDGEGANPFLQLPLHLLWQEVLDKELPLLAEQMGVSTRSLKAAWQQAEQEQRRFQEDCRRRGQEALDSLEPGDYAAVLVGRPYNTADPGLNAGLPLKLRRLGVLPLPIDFLPLEGIDINESCTNMFWYSGQRILAAAQLIQQDPRLQAIYVTNFGCGPDSFLLSFFREAMQGKPFLELEMDDHSADTGLVTRCEAFFDSLEGRRGQEARGRKQDAGCRRQEAGGRMQDAGCKMQDARCKMQEDKGIEVSSQYVGANRDSLNRCGCPPEQGQDLPLPRIIERIGIGKKREKRVRKTYLPYMSDHAHVLAAAMRFHDLPAEVLPPTTEETLEIGRQLCLGRECLPCFTSIGDIVQKTRQDGFDPTASTYFMPTTGGPCRFGQYHHLQRQILDRLGLQEMAILSPTAENSYQGFGDRPIQLRRLAWQGVVGVDLLQKLLHEHRPYEQTLGTTDRLYQELLQKLSQAIGTGGGRHAVAVMEEAARRFAQLPVNRRNGRPIIGVVGEIYIRANPFTNQEIVRKVEALGGEAWVAPMMEWFYFVNYCIRLLTGSTRHYADWLKIVLVDWVQHRDERQLLRPVEALLRNAHEPTIPSIADYARPYYDPILGTEAVLSVGKAVDFAQRGLSGILNLLPFTCMPGTVVAGLSQRIRADHRQIPWLDVIYDAQGETNLHTRLEAFMYQAEQFRERWGEESFVASGRLGAKTGRK